MTEEEPQEKLQEFGKEIAEQVKEGDGPEIEFTKRTSSNVSYDKERDRLTLGNKQKERTFFNLRHAKKFLQTLEVAKLSNRLLDVDKHASLRDMFYMAKRTIPDSNINIVDEQKETDKAIEDLELITGLSREQLHVNANRMGSVAGKVVIEDAGDEIDWSSLGSGGWSIPSNVEDIKFKEVEADYVIYMEKAAVWERLHEDGFWDKENCIIMSSQGQTTRGIRRLLQRLNMEEDLPVFVLTDFDSWGQYIYSVIRYGSISLAHMSQELTVPEAKFLGITYDDIEEYDLQEHLIQLKDSDINRIEQLSNYDWFEGHDEWQREFKKMKELGSKAEIQALSSKGISFISDEYLPEKIENEDWIE